MDKTDHLIWSNYNLDYDDWKDDLEENYPDLTEQDRMTLMYEINSDYLDDERINLDIQLSRPILVIADLGRWNGRFESKAVISKTACMQIPIMLLGMWIRGEIFAVPLSITTEQTIIFTVPTRTV